MRTEHHRNVICEQINLLDSEEFISSLKKDMKGPMKHLSNKELGKLFEISMELAKEINQIRLSEENELLCYLMLIKFFEK